MRDDRLDLKMLVKAFVAEEEYMVISAGDTLQATGAAVRDKPLLIVLDIGLRQGRVEAPGPAESQLQHTEYPDCRRDRTEFTLLSRPKKPNGRRHSCRNP